MKTKLWTTVFVVGLLILLTHFVWVTPALADDVTPPPVPTEEVVVETLPPTEEPVAEVLPIEPVATEEPVVVEPVATEPPTTEEPVPVDLLQDLPADTSLVVLGENGEVLPLATQEAAEVIAIADPIWCPVSASPTPGANGCTSSFASLSDLVAGFVPTGNGTIWIELGNQGGVAVTINGSGNWAAAKNYNLTLQGGWNSSTAGNISGNSTFSVPISITHWTGAVTVNNITVDGATGTGLTIDTGSIINLENFSANNNTINGAVLSVTAAGKIDLKGTNTFNGNGTDTSNGIGNFGLVISTNDNGTVNINNTTANENQGGGVYLFPAHDVSLTGTNNFNNNWNIGLMSYNPNGSFSSTGTLIANFNGTEHELDSAYGAEIFADTVTIDGTNNEFSSNYTDGLHIVVPGAVSLSNVIAQSNGVTLQNSSYGYGVYLDNTSSTSDPKAGISVGGTAVFSGNYNTGLYVASKGDINLSGVTSTNSVAGNGVELRNAASIDLTGTNTFSGNARNGLKVDTFGSFGSTGTLIANSNGTAHNIIDAFGAYITNAASVTIEGTDNEFSSNYSDGLRIVIPGSISLSNITAQHNINTNSYAEYSYGIYLDNRTSTSDPRASIFVGGENIFFDNYNVGLHIRSNGNIIVSGITASSNRSTGCSIFTFDTGNVSLTGTNKFINNKKSGLVVNTQGNFSSTGTLIAELNGTSHSPQFGANGVIIVNAASVTIVGTGNKFSSNYADGLQIDIPGAISLSNITAESNGVTLQDSSYGYGVYLDNTSSTGNPKAGISVGGTAVFSSNYNTGLYVASKGDINLSGVTSTNSVAGNGVELWDAASMNLTNTNTFGSNADNGLKVDTSGSFSSTGKLIANSNGTAHHPNNANGVYINNAASVTISGTGNEFSFNYENGLYIKANGNIIIGGIEAVGNGKNGLSLISGSMIDIQSVTANSNSCIGLQISGSDNITGTISSITGNVIGLLVDNNSRRHGFTNSDIITGNYINITGPGADCIARIAGESVAYVGANNVSSLVYVVFIPRSQTEFVLDCAHQSQYPVSLPNDDLVTIECPVSGKAIIKRLNNTAIPGELPAGYTYTSAFSLDILQSGKSISYISEGGRVNVSFDVPNLEEGTAYTLLYWDNGSWLPLKDFMLDENGNPRQFNLHPNDPRMILSGLKLVFEDGTPRLELSTNFPGIFVLVQR